MGWGGDLPALGAEGGGMGAGINSAESAGVPVVAEIHFVRGI